MSDLLHLLLALGAVIVLGRLLGRICALLSQPPVIGEIIAGIALGPSLLGRMAPATYAYLLPASVAPRLNALAQVGVAIYMFLVGLELNVDRVRPRARATLIISNTGIGVPFLFGAALAVYLYPRLSTADVPFTNFALFIGTAMSITAFPVLARILSDRRLTESTLGSVALTCAALDDVSAWCLLAIVVGVARAQVGAAWLVVVLAAAYIALVLLVARPAAARVVSRRTTPGAGAIAGTLGAAALSAAITQSSAGTFGGCLVAARAAGMSLRDSTALAVLMNTRGLMELIVLNIGLDLGVIAPRLFTMMVLMALATTMATGPVLDRVLERAESTETTVQPQRR